MEQKNNDPIHQYFKPAIVGFWRSGATEEEVSAITGISLPRLVTEYNIIRDENPIPPTPSGLEISDTMIGGRVVRRVVSGPGGPLSVTEFLTSKH